MKILILGGTTEANSLALALSKISIDAIYSYAGRVNSPKKQPIETRIGGFGGVAGLVDFINNNRITHVVDATHPFAHQMSTNAFLATNQTKTPFITLSRPKWLKNDCDDWVHLPTLEKAAEHLSSQDKTAFLAIGKMHLEKFSHLENRLFIRLIDKPTTNISLINKHIVIGKGPFKIQDEIDFLKENRIQIVVSKNSGGQASYSKIKAARELGLQVVMIDRPNTPKKIEVHSSSEILYWLTSDTNLGV